MNVGILAIHGNVAEHRAVLKSLGAWTKDVRVLDDLNDVTHLLIPGGESTVMSKFLTSTGLRTEVCNRARAESLAIFGTCAGAILLAEEVTGKNPPDPLKLLDITVERNAYGTQAQSFRTQLVVEGAEHPIEAAFIRAPIISRIGEGVEVISEYQGQPVIVRSKRLLAATCHPELTGESALHQLFLSF